MKRILILILNLICIFVLCLCGCQKHNAVTNDTQKQIIVFPTEQTAATVNGYREDIEDTENYPTIVYIGNTNSKKFHLADCRYAQNIKQENIIKHTDRNKMINSGYAPCQTCKP